MNFHKLAAALAFGICLLSAPNYAEAAEDRSIRPFAAQVPQTALEDLRRRLADTRWPDRETVNDQSQGIQLAKLQPLVEYWGTGYDWRKAEAKLNALPQFMTTIDGVDIHFIHVPEREAAPGHRGRSAQDLPLFQGIERQHRRNSDTGLSEDLIGRPCGTSRAIGVREGVHR